ncbi:hypothetical protein [Azospirillum sp. TSA6c]|uniref:hypothetical protein n=1 Tax=unclassified Azospirillum TaxID=2630922 RepID=UPI000D60DDC2|nr:hypothetical protein [Azospirillum sp. TSA6c]PWC49356.1 hypothetical protein TSA6c_24600 [Azospirillum sp. TSA6c]
MPTHDDDRSARLIGIAFLLLAPPAYGLLTLAFGMDANWDLRNYHWYNGYAMLTGRIGRDLLAAQMPTFYSPFLDVPFYWLATHLPARAAGFLWGTLQGINLSLLYLLASFSFRNVPALKRTLIAMVLAGAGGLGGGTLGLIGTTFQDNVVSLGVLGAAAVIAGSLPGILDGRPLPSFARVAAAGLLAGAAMGLKNPTVIYAVGLCLGFLALPARPWRRLWLAFFFGLGVLAGLALGGGVWMAHLWHDYGNPVFPHMNHIFKSPFAALSDYVNVSFFPPGLWQRLFFPFVFTFSPLTVGEVPFFDLRVLALFILVPAGVVCAVATEMLGKRNDWLTAVPATRFLLAAMTVTYALWVVMFCIYRYLVPLEMLAPLALVMAVGLLPLARRLRIGLAVALLAVVQLTVQPADWGRVDWPTGANDRWVEADVPAIADPDDTMVLMAGYWAISHVIPSFPARVTFVRIQSNFLQPDSVGNGYLAILKDKVASHRGPFLMMSTIPDTPGAAKAAELLGLRLDPRHCRPIPNNLGETLNLCAVDRMAGKRETVE